MDADQIFQDINSLIRQHEAYELMNHLQHWLYHPNATSVERLLCYEYWHLLLLFKWVIRFGDYRESQNHESVTDTHIDTLFDHLKDLSEKVFALQTQRDLYCFYRVMAVQQFWVQRKESVLLGWGRQAFLFSDLEPKHTIRKLFKGSVGLDIDDFLELSCCLFLHFQPNNHRHVTVSTFSPLYDWFGREKILQWLRAISSSVSTLQDWLQHTDDGKPMAYRGVESEYYEQTPLLRYPLIEARDYFILTSPHVLHASLSSVVYDILRDYKTKARFMDSFGKRFENYVREVLSVLSCPLFTEYDVRDYLNAGEGQKLVDFLAIDKGNNIFIETKGVALSWKGTISTRAGTLRNESESSVLKGIEQAYDVAASLAGKTEINGCTLGTRRNFLLVITYKDMYIGSGKNFRDFIATEEVDRIISAHNDEELIPLSNIFVIAVDDLEIMLGDILNSNLSLSDFLEHAADHNPQDLSRTLAFRNITAAVSGRQRITELPLLTNARDELFARVEMRFQN